MLQKGRPHFSSHLECQSYCSAGLDVLDAGSGEHVLRACALPALALPALQPFVSRSALLTSLLQLLFHQHHPGSAGCFYMYRQLCVGQCRLACQALAHCMDTQIMCSGRIAVAELHVACGALLAAAGQHWLTL